jgi:hypothetical protein
MERTAMVTATPIEMKVKFGISLSTRAVLFDRGSLDDLLDMAEFAEASGYFHGVKVGAKNYYGKDQQAQQDGEAISQPVEKETQPFDHRPPPCCRAVVA